MDLVPKFIMANGKLVKIILHTINVARNLEWKCVDGTYVMQVSKGGVFSSSKAKIHKVPANESEALKSSLMGMFEKRRCAKFLSFVQQYDPSDPKTWNNNQDLNTVPFAALVKQFDLEPNTVDFLGHALALYTSDQFYAAPAYPTLMRISLYNNSIGMYGDSPFIYPVYGIGCIPEGFSRLSAVYGGTYMLN